MGYLTGPAIDILKDLVAGGVGPLTLTKAVYDSWANYGQAREIEGLREFVGFLGAKVGDIQQLLSDPYLGTVEGQRFAHKIFAAAVDARLAEKREVFANAFINGLRQEGVSDIDRLRFVDILIGLSAASLVRFAEIHKRCDPQFDGMGAEWESIGMWSDGSSPAARGAPLDGVKTHYNRAAVKELQAAGLFSEIRLGHINGGPLQIVVRRQGSEDYYTAYTRAFGRFISTPSKK